MNKNSLRTAITTVAIATAIVGIGAGTANARPTAIPDPAPRVGVLLGSDALVDPGENWTCTIRQGATVGTENGTGLTMNRHVVINPMVGDWQPGPVSGFCVGPQGLQPLAPGAAAG
ncbi:hypothetical protein [Rhodococcus sp. WAY2]|uniref:hypothetical protein n=1 Tax=Rhodococcus sp. WAY2 TaxID=2663121 RepID=UPI00135A7D70|nr:hypothetical protein [Rhodococcus sp. WAY2]